MEFAGKHLVWREIVGGKLGKDSVSNEQRNIADHDNLLQLTSVQKF